MLVELPDDLSYLKPGLLFKLGFHRLDGVFKASRPIDVALALDDVNNMMAITKLTLVPVRPQCCTDQYLDLSVDSTTLIGVNPCRRNTNHT